MLLVTVKQEIAGSFKRERVELDGWLGVQESEGRPWNTS